MEVEELSAKVDYLSHSVGKGSPEEEGKRPVVEGSSQKAEVEGSAGSPMPSVLAAGDRVCECVCVCVCMYACVCVCACMYECAVLEFVGIPFLH